MKRVFWIAGILALFFSNPACAPKPTSSFILRDREMDFSRASYRTTETLFSQTQDLPGLQESYPMQGQVETKPDPDHAGGSLLSCMPSPSKNKKDSDCILLNPGGDFIRVQSIDWQSAAFYMYRIYLTPRAIFPRIDRTKDFIAIDFFLMNQPELWQEMDAVIHKAVKELGARPYYP